MKENFAKAFESVIGHEGGFTDDKRDRGNWTSGTVGVGLLKGTKYGVSAMTYPSLDIRNLTVEDAQAIYKRDFWDKCRCDDLPAGVDFLLFDAAINHGASRAIRFLQAAVGAMQDGVIGTKTLLAVWSRDKTAVVDEFCVRRMIFYTRIATWVHYDLGWTRRAFSTHRQALDLALAPQP